MAPSLVRLGAAALAYTSGVVAQEKAYQLKESYTPSNFFDKFSFFSSPDPNRGFVQYRNKDDSTRLGLVETGSEDVKIGVQASGNDQDGRSSVRLESVSTYNSGLFIADFSHFPAKACGAWPAFWMVGPEWPRDGEIDIFEGWNLNEGNKIVLHTDSPLNTGICKVSQADFTSPLRYADCWMDAPNQPGNTGCAVDESNGLWSNPQGGVCEWLSYKYVMRYRQYSY
jgi:beta-glucanase (GH16 family)